MQNGLKTLRESDGLRKQEPEETKKKLEQTEIQKEVSEAVVKTLCRESMEKLMLENQKLSIELRATKREKEETERKMMNEACAHYSGQMRHRLK